MAGLVGGFAHCAGMCGPFVLAQSTAHPDASTLKRLSQAALIPYHFGRMTTYVTLAVLFNGVLNLVFAVTPIRAFVVVPILAMAGVMFLLSAFPSLSAVFPWMMRARALVPFQWLSRASRGLINNPSALQRYGLGILLGFMPCGLVFSALLATSAMPHTLQAALAMSAFALGTMPALMLTAFGGQMASRRFARFFHYATPVLLAFNGVWLIAKAASFIH